MITELALLDVKAGQAEDFLAAFAEARPLIEASPGFVSVELLRSLERDHRFVLRVGWERLEDHTEGFRGSERYLEWKRLLHHFYEPFPEVLHYA